MNQREIIELVGSWLVVSLAFGWVAKDNFGELAFPQNFLFSLVVALVATGTGFILHELAHKYTAIRYGAHAEFFAWPAGLLLALGMAFFLGMVFAAPGAVYIMGAHLSKKQNGIISVAGPVTNVLIAIVFLILSVAIGTIQPMLGLVGFISAQINLFLALFNLIPFGPLDGAKVFAWNKIVWAVLFVPLFVLFFVL